MVLLIWKLKSKEPKSPGAALQAKAIYQRGSIGGEEATGEVTGRRESRNFAIGIGSPDTINFEERRIQALVYGYETS
jgi:hypothetical protein